MTGQKKLASELNELYEINVYNMSMCALEESQHKSCFIKEV